MQMPSTTNQRLTDALIKSSKAVPGKRVELWDADVRGLCLRVSRNSKCWVYRYRNRDGRQPRLAIGEYPGLGLSDARDLARDLRNAVRQGRDPQLDMRRAAEEEQARGFTMRQLCDTYFEACEAGDYRPRRKQKRPSTIVMEKGLWRLYLDEPLGNLAMGAVDRGVMRDVLRHIKLGTQRGRPAPIQANRCRGLLSRMFNFAIWEGRIQHSPMAGVDPPSDEKPRTRVLTDDEIRTLWRGLSGPSPISYERAGQTLKAHFTPRLGVAIKLALVTAQRRGEIAGMRRDELRLEEGEWLIQAGRGKREGQHLVPLSPLAVSLIREAIELQPLRSGGESTPFVFPSPRDPQRSIGPNAITHAACEVYKALELTGVTVHDLRRTAATGMASERLSIMPFVVSQVLGHAADTGGAAAITMRVYNSYQYVAEKRWALEAWADLLAEIVGNSADHHFNTGPSYSPARPGSGDDHGYAVVGARSRDVELLR